MKKDVVNFDDWQKIDIRVGEIKTAQNVEGSKKLLLFTVDFGEDYGTVEILSGIALWFTPEEMVNRKFLFIANLAPRQMMGKVSNGMILAVDGEEKPILFEVPTSTKNGSAAH